jgi:hypothetical protein
MSAWLITKCGVRHKVTHLPSGTTIALFSSLGAARDFIAEIAPLADWYKPAPAADPEVLERVRRAALAERGA